MNLKLHHFYYEVFVELRMRYLIWELFLALLIWYITYQKNIDLVHELIDPRPHLALLILGAF